jgi:hypothetical protein
MDIDTDENGSTDLNENLTYFGGHRTKFTERLFYTEGEYNDLIDKKGFEFKEWVVVIWNYCSYYHHHLARYDFIVICHIIHGIISSIHHSFLKANIRDF